MTVQVARYPIAPTSTKRRGTLLDAATVDDGGFSWLDGEALFDSNGCMTFGSSAAFCSNAAKTFNQGANFVDGFRFAAYGASRCKTVGYPEDLNDGLRAAFERGESAAVEKAMMSTRFVVNAAGAGIPGSWPAPTDITPAAGAVSAKLAAGLLEEYAGSVYTGAPTLHLPLSVASMLLSVNGAEFNGDTLMLRTGTKVAAGAGYAYPNNGPTGAAAAAGERWAYVSGEVYVMRAPQPFVKQAVDLPNNEWIGLVERSYIAAVDCFVAAIRVNTTL